MCVDANSDSSKDIINVDAWQCHQQGGNQVKLILRLKTKTSFGLIEPRESS